MSADPVHVRSSLYYEGHYQELASKIKAYINASQDFLSPQTADSPRAVGDALESLVAEKFSIFLGDWCSEYSSDFARRAMADMAFTDKEGYYSVIDVKTHRKDTRFNMPNLTSVERLARFYESDTNVFTIMMIRYSIEGTAVTVSEVLFSPIEFLEWECLTIGALGWGQIQIANSNDIRVIDRYSRKKWMLQLCEVMSEFYPREIDKIRDRIDRFNTIREHWESKKDIWA
jgi:hypothetical protein